MEKKKAELREKQMELEYKIHTIKSEYEVNLLKNKLKKKSKI